MKQQRLHIVCFDIPYPANYGGAIDVYYRIKALHAAGIQIILHCTYKGDLTHYAELENLCEKVYYYSRTMSLIHLFSRLPLAVAGRPNKQILDNLLKDDAPILYEGLVSCGTMDAPELRKRQKFFRECNVEHDYYRALARATHSWYDRGYYRLEAHRLQRFEHVLTYATRIFALAHQDEAHFKAAYPFVPTTYLPCFHAHDKVNIPAGTGSGILYHGNLRVAENQKAANYIIREIAPLLADIPVIIAGSEANKLHPISNNVILVPDPTDEQLSALIQKAQVHLLVTFQATGLKLKLLNVLYEGRHVVCNPAMVCGTELGTLCHVVTDKNAFAQTCKALYHTSLTTTEQQHREQQLQMFAPTYLINTLLQYVTT